MRDAAEKQLKAAQKKVKSAKLGGDAEVRAEAQLESAEDLIEKGRDLLSDDDIALAFHAFQESLVVSEKLQVMMKAEPALAKARSSGRTARDRSNVRVTAPATATVQLNISTTSGIGGNADVHISAPAATTFHTESTATTSKSLKVVPPPLKIFVPFLDDESENDIKIDISL
jgi:hypothetical protein